MKTKYALFALCLPIAFTACQNEEFVNVKDYSQELKNRGEIDVILSASYPAVGNFADTRMSAEENGNALSFLWEESTDKLGAALMDEETAGTVKGDKTYNNYPFIAQSSGATSTFASPSSITKGIYLFYNSYKDVLDRKPLSLSLQTQVYDPTDVKTPAQQMVKYMNMVAPMVNLNEGIKLADAAAFNLPLEFVNLYTPVKLPVKFVGAPEGTKLTKITINGSSDFVLGGKLNPTVLAGTNNANVLKLKEGTIDAADLAKAKEVIEGIVQKGADAAGIYSTTEPVNGAAELSIKDGIALTNDEVQNFWILIPRGQYPALKINAETTNGNMILKELAIPDKLEGYKGNPRDFTSETRSISPIVLDFNAGGNVVQPYDFTINNTTDWNNYIKYVADHLEHYVGRDITFTIGGDKSVYVTSLPTFGFTLKGGDDSSKLIFGNEDKSAVTAQLDLSGITMGSNVNFEVGEGATVTLRKAQKDGTIAALTNNGTLTVEATSDITALTNNKTLNFKSSSAAAVVMPKVENKGEATVNVLGVTEFTAFTNEAKATITVAKNAELKLAGSANAGTIVNNGTLENASSFNNEGVIDNYGVLEVVSTFTNNGKIIVQDGSSSNNVQMTNNGIVEVINPTTYSALKDGKQYNITTGGTVTAVVTNRKDYLAAKSVSNMSITLGGGEWSIVAADATVADANRDLKEGDITTALSLQSDLNVKETANLGSNLELTVTGTSTIKAAAGKTLTVKKLEVAKGATATIAQGAAVIIPNASASENGVDVKGTLINNGKLYTPEVATIAGFDNVKKFNIAIAADATLTNNAIIGGELNTQAMITVNGNLNNAKGTIYGQNKIENAQSYQRGIVYPFPEINTSTTDLSSFAGAKSITATSTVTTIPENVNIKFTGAASLNLDAGGNYGELTFTASANIKATVSDVKISKITIDGSVTFTVDGGNAGQDFICNDLVKLNGATLTNSNNKLKDAEGTPWT